MESGWVPLKKEGKKLPQPVLLGPYRVAKRGRNGSVAAVWERRGPARARRRQPELQPAAAGAEPEEWAGSVGGAGPELLLQEVVLKVEDLRLTPRKRPQYMISKEAESIDQPPLPRGRSGGLVWALGTGLGAPGWVSGVGRGAPG